MASEALTTFEFRIGSLQEADVEVRRIAGQEGLCQPYRFDIDFFPSSDGSLEIHDLCDTEALLTIRGPQGDERLVHGIVDRVRMSELVSGAPHYQARLVPRLERLRHRQRSQVFQKLSPTDIVKQVLDEAGVQQRWSLSGTYPQREYCVQYRETDFAFISRLLEDAGIFYFFEHASDGHTLVLLDATSQLTDRGLQAGFKFGDGAGDAEEEEHLFRLSQQRRVATSKVTLKDFDFERPGVDVSAESTASHASAQASGEFQRYEYPGGFTDPSVGTDIAQVRLEEQRVGAASTEGESSFLSFQPGVLFETSDHPDPAFNEKLLLLTVSHEGARQEGTGDASGLTHAYRNQFEAQPADLPYRPPRLTPRPRALPTTGTVVGPSGEEIATDSLGRVRVQFHWDREGQKDDRSSCWIRCAQSWAGAGFGALFLPRIGQEVLVKFLGGDPDQPLVAGATYNGQHPPPVSLPQDKTQSLQRSDSSPGGGGSNELRFEDQAGVEDLYLHAQHDETIEVLANKSQSVAASESLEVVKDRSQTISANQTLAVAADDTKAIGGDDTLSVSRNREVQVARDHTESVAAAQSSTVAASRSLSVRQRSSEVVGGSATVTIAGDLDVQVGAVMSLVVGANLSRTIGASLTETVGGTREEVAAGNAQSTIGGDFNASVQADLAQSTGGDQTDALGGNWQTSVDGVAAWTVKEFDFSADKLTIIVDGNTALAIDNSGNVTFGAAGFTINGSDLTFKGSSVKMNAAGSADSGSAKVPKLQPQKGDRASVAIVLEDADGNPVANEWFTAQFSDGTTREGRTDADGKATVFGPKEGSVQISLTKRDQSSWRSG